MSSENTRLLATNDVDTLLRRTLKRLGDPVLVAQFNRDLFSYRDYARSLLVRTIPGAPRLTALHFSSGSNNPGEIRGFADIGKSPGVALKSVSKRLGKPVLVLQCGGKKAKGTVPIRELYTGKSSQWGVYRSALERLGSPDKHPYVNTFVLSAKLGLMPENKAACPYDLVLKQDGYKRGDARPVDAEGTPVRRVRALVAWMKKDPDQARLLRSLKGRTVYFSGQARGEPYYTALERLGALYGFTVAHLPEYTARIEAAEAAGKRGGGTHHRGAVGDFLKRLERDKGELRYGWANLCQEPCLRELISAVKRGIPVFIDSGAFSEVDLSGKRPDVPITDEDWRERLARYRRVVEGVPADKRSLVNVVAPDRIGDQQGTLERLRRYKTPIRAFIRAGVSVLVPLQPGAQTPAQFYGKIVKVLATNDFIPSIPMPAWRAIYRDKKERGEQLYRFLIEVCPKRIHLLGFGPTARDRPEIADAILRAGEVCGGDPLQVQADSVIMRGKLGVGRKGGKGGGAKPLTLAQDSAEMSLQARNWPATAEETWREVQGGRMTLTQAHDIPSTWMSTEQIEEIAQYSEDIDPNSGTHMGALAPDVQTAILTNIDVALMRTVRWDGRQWIFSPSAAEGARPLRSVLRMGIRKAWDELDSVLDFAKQKKREAVGAVFGDEGGRPVEGEPVTVLANKRR